VLSLAVALAMLLAPLHFSLDSSADTPTTTATVSLVDSNGDEINVPLINSVLGFDTVNNDGTIEYSVPVEKISREAPAYLRIGAPSGMFNLTVSAENVSGVLVDTGFTVFLEDGGTRYHATLTEAKAYVSQLLDEDDRPADLVPGKDYLLTIYTAEAYHSQTVPQPSPGVDLFFGIDAVETMEVSFFSDGELVVKKTYKVDSVLGELPSVEKQGYELEGWKCGDTYVGAETLVSALTSDVIAAEWSEISPGPGPEPPEPEPVPPEPEPEPEPEPPEPEPVPPEPEPEPPVPDEPIIETKTEVIENDDGSVTTIETTDTTYPDGKTSE